MTDVIRVEGLSFQYPGAEQTSLTGVDLAIERGDFVAVVGSNGSGKTTLCKSFNGLIPHFWSGEFSGKVTVDGVDTLDASVAALSHRVGYVYQDFGNQLVRPSVRDDVCFGPLNFGLPDFRARAEDAMRLLGIDHLAPRYIWELSGGQQHLTALAGVLAMEPAVIVVDEPVAELDPARAEETYRILARVNAERGTTIVVIEHHAEFIARYARSVVLMADGAVRWHLPVREALSRTGELAGHGIPAPQIVSAVARLAPEAEVPLTIEEARDALVAAGRRPVAGRTTEAAAGTSASDPVVATLTGVGHGYRDVHGARSAVLDEVSLSLHAGERVAVVGSNGAGKSTLLRLLTGIIVPRTGTVEVNGVDTRSVRPAELAEHVCYLYQHPEQMFLKDSVRQEISMFPAQRGRPGTAELVDRVLRQLRLTELAERDGRTLSGGQQRRVTLGIGLAMSPSLLLLDEPTSSLDVSTRHDVTAMLDTLSEHIRCVMVATHDMQLVAEWATRVLVLDGGRVVADTTPAALFDTPELTEAVRLIPPQISLLGRSLGMSPPPLSVDALVAACSPADLIGTTT
ncbi:ABC transporter ATP-binding protein [Nocardia puris]|uniref:ABC transporter ATP-binding protein n=1 Tax=Nocardia puris TaxID=208602 RepID=UPI001893202B|nr:ATP-binding cassette domain-containing protein [Nocardia puris]MBF6214003.1 ABC transporter ATP-binding protein [Nocardia puris]MBF6368700.1 ABC transporter ATP-binding protein [Nocardia puris]MBF6461615.1 ABC transporter ATP-binding protein [Nocardia puris]